MKGRGEGRDRMVRRRPVTAVRVFALIITVLFVSLILDARGIHTWAARLKKETYREFFTNVTSPLLAVSEKAGAAPVWGAIRLSFHAWVKGVPPSPPIPLSQGSGERVSFPEQYYRILRGETAKPKPVYTARRPLELLVAGDSLAWLHVPTMLTKTLSGNPCVNITSVSKISSNFSDTSYFDWIPGIKNLYAEKIEKDGRRYDCLVMIIGANDAQSIYLGEDRLFYGTPEWQAEFENRVRQYMSVAASLFTRIFWIAIPPMRKDGYRDRMVTVNGIYEKLCGEFQWIEYVRVKDLLGDENGNYLDAKIIDGKQQVIRSVDGIHYEYAGGQLVAGRIKNLLEADFTFVTP